MRIGSRTVTMSNMPPAYNPVPQSAPRKGMNMLLIPLIIAITGFFGALGFGVWAYLERNDYKDNSDAKVAAAVEVAEAELSSKKDNEFLEREKEPLRDFKGSAVFGNITFKYPKTWSGHLLDSEDRFELKMNPGLVSANPGAVHALTVVVEREAYNDYLRRYETFVKSGTARASAFRLQKVPTVLGTRIDGEISQGVKGSAVVLPLRDKTMVISTQSEDFVKDFNTIILPNYSYSP